MTEEAKMCVEWLNHYIKTDPAHKVIAHYVFGHNGDCGDYGEDWMWLDDICKQVINLIESLSERNSQFEYTLVGVMHFVDKWLNGIEPYSIIDDNDGQIAIERAAEARRITLKYIEGLQKQLDQVTRERDAAVEREWDLFDLLSSAWHGKQYYFKQEDGSVYSRESCQYLTFDQAIDEFAQSLTVAGDINVPTTQKWISVKEGLPKADEVCIAVNRDGDMMIGHVRKLIDGSCMCDDINSSEWIIKVTHWMPLPKPPKET